MIKKENTYALWLRPSQTQIDEFTNIISKLSHRFRSPPFPPHITLLSSISSDLDNIMQACKKIVAQHHSFDLSLGEIAYSESYYRNFYVLANLNAELDRLYQKSKKLLKTKTSEPYMPHVSLLYGNLKQTQQQTLQRELSNSYPEIFKCQRLDIFNATGDVIQWNLIESFYLSSSE